jgi:D-arabinose 1-dehydrogenase-like Zn-dependent alcohol dehydrogenase
VLADGGFPGIKFPRILGHEVTGIIEDVGPGVPRVMTGNRVGVPWVHSACGRCPQCLSGDEVLCSKVRVTGLSVNGGYAEYMIAQAAYATPIPDELDLTEAAPLFCAGLTAYKGLKIGGIGPARKVAVVGIGGLGHLAIQFARNMGAWVIAVTGTDEKENLARELGAHHTVNTRSADPLKELKYIGGADMILSTLSDASLVERYVSGLAPDGTLVMVGIPSNPITVYPQDLVQARRRIVASPSGSRRDLHEMLEFCVLHHIRPIVETFPLEHAEESHRRVRSNLPRFRDVLIANE